MPLEATRLYLYMHLCLCICSRTRPRKYDYQDLHHELVKLLKLRIANSHAQSTVWDI